MKKALLLALAVLAGPRPAEATNVYYFGHSLVWHQKTKQPTPKDHASLPHWLALMAQQRNDALKADGQYGFLRDHAKLPPQAKWRFALAPSAWKDSFAASEYDAVVLTTENFIQIQPHSANYYDGDSSPLDATLQIARFVMNEAPDARFIIYENWPELSLAAPGFPKTPATTAQRARYSQYCRADFHNWWVDYVADLRAALPKLKLEHMPIGPVVCELLVTDLKNVPLEVLFEDGDPHGLPSIYLLAAMVHFFALWGDAPPSIELPQSIHPAIRDGYDNLAQRVATLYPTYKAKKFASTRRRWRDLMLPVGGATAVLALIAIAAFLLIRRRRQA